MKVWERVWGRLDEDRTCSESLRKPHRALLKPNGRVRNQCGRVGFSEASHGHAEDSIRPCVPGRVGSLKSIYLKCRILELTRAAG
ncbi:unnamed protein product [Linum trigynum]|uniref:Uncharacterized protein n=1 Tax=Linum trigynum TaxID=586398 RepID=A0AAV2F5Y0_9ROSI